ncbi:right-handed parallel beta-helix repeat-containing protein [Alkalicoccobacillus gibsonii]|uniref:Right-handed parallel beta-helix repeat-containing protein n=1 Tax=Alkalicoccobacillus gibsonii TaxID=79881 RepID=A0ABU9VDC8_9BACI
MKRTCTLFILLAGLLVAGCQEQQFATSEEGPQLYVATDGDDSNAGTIEEPLLTLEEAADRATAGTTVTIREGIYYEPLIVQHSGTKDQPIRFEAYEEEEVHLSGEQLEDGLDDVAMIEISGKGYITIDGLEVEHVTTEHEDKTVIGVLVSGPSEYVELTNLFIHDIATYKKDGNAHGIAVYGEESISDIDITNNTLTDLKLGWSEALVVNGDVSDFLIADNHVHHTNNIGIDVIGYEGIAADPDRDFARNGIIRGNDVHHNSSYDNPSYGKEYSAGGIYVDGGSDILIEENTVYQNDIGIEATSEHKDKFATNINILNNDVYENVITGISIGGYDSERGGTTDSVIAGNTLSGNDTKDLEGAQLLVQYYAYSNRVEQNKLTASQTGLLVTNDNKENDDIHFSENDYVYDDDTKPRWIWRGEEVTSLEAFQEVTQP